MKPQRIVEELYLDDDAAVVVDDDVKPIVITRCDTSDKRFGSLVVGPGALNITSKSGTHAHAHALITECKIAKRAIYIRVRSNRGLSTNTPPREGGKDAAASPHTELVHALCRHAL
eukprot:6459956-Amphidinium_carterae.2